ncbi:hypothetical protein Lal_00037849 [Lupinus albus]|nr:hypothetical protein Lal_00037849 [Lupinus albus]
MCTPPTNYSHTASHYTHTLVQENLRLLFTLLKLPSKFLSDEDDIELIDDEEEEDDVEIGSSELHGSTTLRNDNDLYVGMQFESKESTLDAIKQFHIRNSFDYIVVESMPYRYVGCCTHYGAGCEWRIRASFNVKRGVWEIRKINGAHTCLSTVVSQNHTKLNSAFISNCIINLVSEDPGIPIKAIVKEIVSRFGYTFGLQQTIPEDPPNFDKLHKIDLRSKIECNWVEKHEFYFATDLMERTVVPQAYNNLIQTIDYANLACKELVKILA